MPHVEARDISKRFGQTVAVKRLSFSVAAGESVCLFGPSGCGKTTTLRIVAGLERPTEGALWIDGDCVNAPADSRPPRPGTIGMVFQDLALWPHMRVERHPDFVLRGLGLSRRDRLDRIRRVLEVCRIAPYRRAYPAALSGGEQQRLAIARALAAEPPLLLLDEPFANLDADLRRHFLGLFLEQKRRGTTILLACHDRQEAELLADRLLIMESGRYRVEEVSSREQSSPTTADKA